MKQFRRNSIFLLSLTLAISSLMGTSAQAANSGYRYWGYFQAAPNAKVWSEAMTGPTVVMADGAVEGWAFTFSGDKVPDAASPRVLPTFAKICGSTKAAGANSKRVGIVIDFGRAALRPEGESTPRSLFKCVVVDKSAIGFDVLAKWCTEKRNLLSIFYVCTACQTGSAGNVSMRRRSTCSASSARKRAYNSCA